MSSFLTPEEERALNDHKGPYHHLAKIERKNYYHLGVCKTIQIIYILAAIFWILIVWWCQIYRTDIVGWFFILLPLIIFGINLSQVFHISEESEKHMFTGEFLSFAFLISSILISWAKLATQPKFFRLLFLAIIFIMLSFLDVWVTKEFMIIKKHLNTILQTAAISLLAIALYMYYIEIVCTGVVNK